MHRSRNPLAFVDPAEIDIAFRASRALSLFYVKKEVFFTPSLPIFFFVCSLLEQLRGSSMFSLDSTLADSREPHQLHYSHHY